MSGIFAKLKRAVAKPAPVVPDQPEAAADAAADTQQPALVQLDAVDCLGGTAPKVRRLNKELIWGAGAVLLIGMVGYSKLYTPTADETPEGEIELEAAAPTKMPEWAKTARAPVPTNSGIGGGIGGMPDGDLPPLQGPGAGLLAGGLGTAQGQAAAGQTAEFRVPNVAGVSHHSATENRSALHAMVMLRPSTVDGKPLDQSPEAQQPKALASAAVGWSSGKPASTTPASAPNVPQASAPNVALASLAEKITAPQAQDVVKTYLPTSATPALSPFEIKAGSAIPAVLTEGIVADNTGPVSALVRANVYDTQRGDFLLIPKGAKLMGVATAASVIGQARVLVAWNRIILPDGRNIDIRNMPGADFGGYLGFTDQVNNHWLRMFGTAMMSGFVSGMASAAQSDTETAQGAAAAGVAAGVTQTTQNIIQTYARVAPTITIRPGYKFVVKITSDIVFAEPYTPRAPSM